MAEGLKPTTEPCARCGGEARPAFVFNGTDAVTCSACHEYVCSALKGLWAPPIYVLATVTGGRAPAWTSLAAERRGAIERVVQLVDQLARIGVALGEANLTDEGLRPAIEFVNQTHAGISRHKLEMMFMMSTIAMVAACATDPREGPVGVNEALGYLGAAHPERKIDRALFESAVSSWKGNPEWSGKWADLAKVVSWDGKPESLKDQWKTWRKEEGIGSGVNAVLAARRG